MSDQPFEVTLRLVLVRLVCYAAVLLSILVLLQMQYILFLFAVITIIHHVFMSIGRYFSLPRVLDLAFTISEMSAMILPYTAIHSLSKWMSRTDLFSTITRSTLLLFLAISAASKFRDIIKYGLWEKYNIRRTELSGSLAHTLQNLNGPNTTLHVVRDVFLGRAPWEAQFYGEPKWIVLSRGILAAWIIIVITVFACYNVVLETVRQAALTPVSDLRGGGIPWDFTTTQAPVWNVIFTRMTDGRDEVNFASAFQVTPLRLGSLRKVPCSRNPELEFSDELTEDFYLEFVVFHCPALITITKNDLYNFATYSRAQYIVPDLLVTVNFTVLNISATTVVDTPKNSVQLMVGLTNDTRRVIQTTIPTTLIPGVNLFGMVIFKIRQIISSSVLAAIGLFDIHETFLISEINHVWPDPRVSTSLIPQGPDIATIRLTPQVGISEWQVIQERRDKSVIRGLSSAGGLWTALGGLLSIFFGSSIMRLMFGLKPLSIFGLAHKVQNSKVRDACVNEYPHIILDVNGIQQADRGLVSLMCDHLLDVDHFKEKEVVVDDQLEVALPLLPVIHPSSPISLDGTSTSA